MSDTLTKTSTNPAQAKPASDPSSTQPAKSATDSSVIRKFAQATAAAAAKPAAGRPPAPAANSAAARPPAAGKPAAPAYESKLQTDPGLASNEGNRHFEGRSAVFDAQRKIAARLDELKISYCVIGGMAMFQHGLRRFTDHVDILVTKADLKKVHESLDGNGYARTHKHGKHLRDAETGVRVQFTTSGDFPGDGKEKPVAFPEPGSASFERDGVKFIVIETLIELKLASGMTHPGRMKDLSDVLELIKLLDMPEDMAEKLNPYVKEKFSELWRQATKRFVIPWWLKDQLEGARTIEETIASLRKSADRLDTLRQDGISLEFDPEAGHQFARLVTTAPDVARQYDMIEESEFWGQPSANGAAG